MIVFHSYRKNLIFSARIRRMGKVLFSHVCVCPQGGYAICSTFLFQVKYSVLNLFLLLVCMQLPIQNHYIHMTRQRKGSIQISL